MTEGNRKFSAASIPRRPEEGRAPLSYAQEGIWYLDRLQPGVAAYNLQLAWRLHGPLSTAILKDSLNALVARHEVLRTSFEFVDEKLVQIIASQSTVDLKIVSRAAKPASSPDRLNAWIHEQRCQPFDLTRAPLLRATLLEIGLNDHAFLLTLHHIIGDAWSMEILKQEISEFYGASLAAAGAPTLPDLPLQYADFAVWQREWLRGADGEKLHSFWSRELEGAPPLLELPTDRTRRPLPDDAGTQIETSIPPDLEKELKDLGARENATLFMTLMTCFKILLYRQTGQEDVVVGTPIAIRNRSELEGMAGLFLNNLALRTRLSGELSFCQLLGRVRDTTLRAFQHHEYPFERLVQEMRERDNGSTPLFQVFFNMFVDSRTTQLGLTGLEVEELREEGNDTVARFDLSLYVRRRDGRLILRLVYRRELFGSLRMAAWLEQYEQLLRLVVADPGKPISSYSLVRAADRIVLPDPTAPLSDRWEGSVGSRLSQVAARQPQHPAVVDPCDTWNYEELESRSNQLARYLRKEGVQEGETVAILAHRSASLVWAWCGVLKAGAAVMNLDPAYPGARLRQCLELAGPAALIELAAGESLSEGAAEGLPTLRCWRTLPTLSEAKESDPFAGLSPAPVEFSPCPDDIACVVFTSGTTGQPKGVLQRHGPLTHFLPWTVKSLGLTPEDRLSMLSGLAHDPLQRDILTSIWCGATLYIPDADQMSRPGYLAEWMQESGITFAHLTPPMSQTLAGTADPEISLPLLRHVVFLGDRLTRHQVSQLHQLAPQARVVNSYGTTETHRATSNYVIPLEPVIEEDWEGKRICPLGRGIPGVQLLVLNEQGQLAGVGERGQIYVRSPHLALGYLEDPLLTDERFLANPFTRKTGDRLYRTGDLGRYRPDGIVEFAGRADRQIQIRGFRVEPAEIEALLTQHRGVREAVVVATNDGCGDGADRLVSCCVIDPGSGTSPTALRAFLQERLPGYMVPAVIESVKSIPRTPNGKVDYRRLSTRIAEKGSRVRVVKPPRTTLEKHVARVWREVLHLSEVGIDDNFFDLGGHSLLAIQLLSRVKEEFGREIRPAMLFQAPTIAAMAGILGNESGRTAQMTDSLVPIRRTGSRPPLFCIPGNLGNVFADLGGLARYLDATHPVYGFQDGVGNPARLEQMASRYVDQLRAVQNTGPYFLVGVCSGGMLAFEMAQQLCGQGSRVALLAMIEPAHASGSRISGVLEFMRVVFLRSRRKIGRRRGTAGFLTLLRRREVARIKGKVLKNLWFIRQYRPSAYPGILDLFLSHDTLGKPDPRRLAWRRLAGSGAMLHTIPGDHSSITGAGENQVDTVAMQQVAEILNLRLAEEWSRLRDEAGPGVRGEP